jgi:CRP/FNR family transcriptional regulator, cyclic AMP receptor protein
MQQILALCRDLPERRFEAGEVLLPEGERTGMLHVLIEGQVEVVKGDFPVYQASEPGAMFGEISALLDIPHTATVRSRTPCRTHVVADAATFLKRHPEIAHAVSRLLAQRLHGVTSYLADIKAQFQEHRDHFSMLDEVLETLLHDQHQEFSPGSDRCPDPPRV